MNVKYIVGHYIQYIVSRDFHVDFTHEDYKSAMSSFRHLCAELPEETDVEVRKLTTEEAMKIERAAWETVKYEFVSLEELRDRKK